MNRHSNRKQSTAWAALLTAAALCVVLAPAAQAQEVAQVRPGSSGIDFLPVAENSGFVLTVSGPEGFHHRAEFGPGESPSFSIFDEAGGAVADGTYNWELTVIPTQTQRREALEANRLGTRSGGTERLIQSGAFSIVGGSVVAGGETEPGQEPAGSGPVLAPKDFVINDDLIVTLSACIGNDCTNGESFGFDTLRLKENNTRIRFFDTSVGSFPSVDWEIQANDSANGGQSWLRINDLDNARSPFTIEANTPSHTLYVDSAKRVGIGTSTPVVELHVKAGNTPALRLEQDTSSGFTAQSYDVGANEANFFIRDNTTGSKLPLRIRPGAPTSSIDVAASGNVGIGTPSPGTHDNSGDSAAVHIRRTSDTVGGLLIERATGAAASDVLLELKNNGTPRIDMIDTNSGTEWRFEASGAGFNINDLADGGSAELVLQTDGDLIIEGSLTVGPGGCTNCDLVFSPEYEVESIEEHASYMWENRHLPGVGPTPEDQPMNLSQKTGGILNELEKAHIYIEEVNRQLKAKDEQIEDLSKRLGRLEAALAER